MFSLNTMDRRSSNAPQYPGHQNLPTSQLTGHGQHNMFGTRASSCVFLADIDSCSLSNSEHLVTLIARQQHDYIPLSQQVLDKK